MVQENDIENQNHDFINFYGNKKNFDKTTLDIEKNEKSNLECCVTCFGGCGFILLMLGIVVGWITWAIFSVTALVNTSNDEIKDKCSDSNLWILLLLTVIIGFINLLTSNVKSNKEDEEQKVNVVNSLVSIALLIWSGIELFSPCALDNLDDTRIYLLVEINFWAGVSICGIFICCIPCLFCTSDFSQTNTN